MRNNFTKQLNELNEKLENMGRTCEDCITWAAESLLLGNRELGERAVQAERESDAMKEDIQALCIRMLLQQQPVARDLRLISAALSVITDMERIADQGSDIAFILQKAEAPLAPFNEHIAAMADCIIRMVSGSVESFVKRDAHLARETAAQDESADALFRKIKNDILDLLMKSGERGRAFGESALNTLMIAKYLERIGDHAVNITESAVLVSESAAGE